MSAGSLLARCEAFIAGFDDDGAQEGVSSLLADLRQAIAKGLSDLAAFEEAAFLSAKARMLADQGRLKLSIDIKVAEPLPIEWAMGLALEANQLMMTFPAGVSTSPGYSAWLAEMTEHIDFFIRKFDAATADRATGGTSEAPLQTPCLRTTPAPSAETSLAVPTAAGSES